MSFKRPILNHQSQTHNITYLIVSYLLGKIQNSSNVLSGHGCEKFFIRPEYNDAGMSRKRLALSLAIHSISGRTQIKTLYFSSNTSIILSNPTRYKHDKTKMTFRKETFETVVSIFQPN